MNIPRARAALTGALTRFANDDSLAWDVMDAIDDLIEAKLDESERRRRDEAGK